MRGRAYVKLTLRTKGNNEAILSDHFNTIPVRGNIPIISSPRGSPWFG